MSVQDAINRLGVVTHAAGSQADMRELARAAYMNAHATQAALSGLIHFLGASGLMPTAAWDKALEKAYADHAALLEGAARSIILPPAGKA